MTRATQQQYTNIDPSIFHYSHLEANFIQRSGYIFILLVFRTGSPWESNPQPWRHHALPTEPHGTWTLVWWMAVYAVLHHQRVLEAQCSLLFLFSKNSTKSVTYMSISQKLSEWRYRENEWFIHDCKREGEREMRLIAQPTYIHNNMTLHACSSVPCSTTGEGTRVQGPLWKKYILTHTQRRGSVELMGFLSSFWAKLCFF